MSKKNNDLLIEIIAKKNNEILELKNEIKSLKKYEITSILLDKKESLKS